MKSISFTDAAMYVHARIVERYGDDPSVIDELNIEVHRCRHEDSEDFGHVIVVLPRGEALNQDNLIFAYWGRLPVMAERE